MARRLLPALLIVLAVVADANADHGLARFALLAAVPLTAVAAIVAFGEWLDNRGEGLALVQAVLSSLILTLLVLSCAIRSGAIQGVPPAASSSLLAALGLLVVKALVACAPHVRRASELWPAKP